MTVDLVWPRNEVRVLRVRHTTAPTPEGCRWCGWPYGGHVQQWVPGRGWHGWTEPTRAQIDARMRVRFATQRPATTNAREEMP